jgi:hypothetical protein
VLLPDGMVGGLRRRSSWTNPGGAYHAFTVTARSQGMPSLEDTEVVVFHVRHGKVTEVWEHPGDLYVVDQFFA